VLHAAEVPFGPINNVADIMADVHAKAREMIIEHVDVDGRMLRMEGVFPKMSATPGRVKSVGGALGADNDDVFGKLGLSQEHLAELSKNGII
jgi:crotonobetainyl-CoA:carnitine CoA-transferase CaiB-like acyl-CoA transferase